MGTSQACEIIAKVRVSGCLREDELQVLTSLQTTLETRSKIDDLDRDWEVAARKYVQRRAKSGALFLPSVGEALVLCVIGLLIASFGLYMLCQMLIAGDRMEPTILFFAAVLGCGAWMLYQGCLGLRLVQRYEIERQSYQTARLNEESRLAPNNRPVHRVCPNCLSMIQ